MIVLDTTVLVYAVGAAAAVAAGAAAIVSADRAFAAVPRLVHVLPDHDGVRRLIRCEGGR